MITTVLSAYIDTYDDTEVKQAGYDYLIALLHKIGVLTAAGVLHLTPQTIYRIIDSKRSIESISYLSAAYLVFMCETNHTILTILDRRPRATAYYR